MNNLENVYRKTEANYNFKTQRAIRNILFALAMSLCYLLGKHFQAVQNSPANTLTKVDRMKN
ncbi:MAG TPA: hypothetical protein VK671_09385 [Mucilaginibacter sp.]|nr:hypothetical protein [Mucilaginibacter sp.]